MNCDRELRISLVNVSREDKSIPGEDSVQTH